MANIKFTPIYSMTTGQPIINTTDIGNHQVNELGDGTCTISTNTIDMPEYDFTALASVRLDDDELYKLYVALDARFRFRQGGA
jgi:hypothetical protein